MTFGEFLQKFNIAASRFCGDCLDLSFFITHENLNTDINNIKNIFIESTSVKDPKKINKHGYYLRQYLKQHKQYHSSIFFNYNFCQNATNECNEKKFKIIYTLASILPNVERIICLTKDAIKVILQINKKMIKRVPRLIEPLLTTLTVNDRVINVYYLINPLNALKSQEGQKQFDAMFSSIFNSKINDNAIDNVNMTNAIYSEANNITVDMKNENDIIIKTDEIFIPPFLPGYVLIDAFHCGFDGPYTIVKFHYRNINDHSLKRLIAYIKPFVFVSKNDDSGFTEDIDNTIIVQKR